MNKKRNEANASEVMPQAEETLDGPAKYCTCYSLSGDTPVQGDQQDCDFGKMTELIARKAIGNMELKHASTLPLLF